MLTQNNQVSCEHVNVKDIGARWMLDNRSFQCLLSCLSHGNYFSLAESNLHCRSSSSIGLHLDFTYLRYWLQCHVPCSFRESQIFSTTSKVSLVRGETLLCALPPRLLQVYLPGLCSQTSCCLHWSPKLYSKSTPMIGVLLLYLQLCEV